MDMNELGTVLEETRNGVKKIYAELDKTHMGVTMGIKGTQDLQFMCEAMQSQIETILMVITDPEKTSEPKVKEELEQYFKTISLTKDNIQRYIRDKVRDVKTDFSNKINSLSEKIDVLMSSLASQGLQISGTVFDFSTLASSESMTRVEGKIDGVNEKVEGVDGKVSGLADTAGRVEGKIDVLTNDISAINKKISEVAEFTKPKKSTVKQSIEKYGKKLAVSFTGALLAGLMIFGLARATAPKMPALSVDNSGYTERFDDIDSRIDEIGDIIDSIGDKVNENGDKIDEISDKVAENGDKIDEIGDKADENGEKIDEIGNKVDENGDKIDEISDKVDENGDKIDEIGDKVDEIDDKINKGENTNVPVISEETFSSADMDLINQWYSAIFGYENDNEAEVQQAFMQVFNISAEKGKSIFRTLFEAQTGSKDDSISLESIRQAFADQYGLTQNSYDHKDIVNEDEPLQPGE